MQNDHLLCTVKHCCSILQMFLIITVHVSEYFVTDCLADVSGTYPNDSFQQFVLFVAVINRI